MSEEKSAGYIFKNPFDVLGRAIQPPDIENIKGSIKSLLGIGALQLVRQTLQPGTDQKSTVTALKITDIGQLLTILAVDLKLGRLCLMGFLFGCLQHAVTVAALLAQQKTFFDIDRRVEVIDWVRYSHVQEKFDAGQHSDIIIMLNCFYEWRQKFLPNLQLL